MEPILNAFVELFLEHNVTHVMCTKACVRKLRQ